MYQCEEVERSLDLMTVVRHGLKVEKCALKLNILLIRGG